VVTHPLHRTAQIQNRYRADQTQSRPDTDTDTEEGKGSREVALVALGLPDDWFERFWKKYPNKIDPKGSKKKLVKALKGGIQLQTIMDGLDRYIAKTDDRPWCNPTTWINQARWDEQHTEVIPHGKAKTGGSIVTALKDLSDHFDREAAAEREALDDLEARGDDVLRIPAE
jgi:hypothetical protein